MTARYSDAQLITFLQKAARRVNRKLNLFGTLEEVVVNSLGVITAPDNDILYDLVLLQAECLIFQRDTTDALIEGSEGVLVRDGEQTVDTSSLASLRNKLLDSDISPCKELDIAMRNEQLRRSSGNMVW